MGDNRIVPAAVFSARTTEAGSAAESELAPAAVDGDLDGLRARWNQFGVATLIRVEPAQGHGVSVRYRLTVDGHPDPQAVHEAFRGDLDAALARAAAPPTPVSWDLAAMGQADAAPAPVPAPARVYVVDADYDWGT
jgi:hypothetical protein